MSKPASKSILIIGLGMIGGSIARGLRKAEPKRTILACDQDQEALDQATREKVIDDSGAIAKMCPHADIVIIALPPLTIGKLLPEIAQHIKDDAIVTDVASVKSHVLSAAAEIGEDFLSKFVPAHPIAGSEQSGKSVV